MLTQEMDDVFDDPTEISADELREFLEADGVDVDADPLFRERLRRRLWSIVRDRFGSDEGNR